MLEFFEGFWRQHSYWEWVAVALAVAYLLLAMRQRLLCWYAAFIGSAIFAWIYFDVALVMESALSLYYVVMAVYGWYQWRYGGPDNSGTKIHRWSAQQHLLAVGSVISVSLISGYLLSDTRAAMPYLDSFTTWGAVLTTWMVTRKVLENWLYWQVLNSLSIYLYIDRGLYPTVTLYVIYLVLAVIGWLAWRRQYLNQQSAGPEHESAGRTEKLA